MIVGLLFLIHLAVMLLLVLAVVRAPRDEKNEGFGIFSYRSVLQPAPKNDSAESGSDA